MDLGPASRINGGEIIAFGTQEEFLKHKVSETAKYLSGRKSININRILVSNKSFIKITNATANNLAKINLKIPVNGMTVITGVSGSGKSSLVFDVIARSAAEKKQVNCKTLEGLENFENIISSNQSPIGSSPLSTPITYIDLFDEIRAIFANTALAKEKKYSKSAFSFNNKEGRCNTCNGLGQIKTSMDFLSDIWIECEDCKGKRYKKQILEVLYKGK